MSLINSKNIKSFYEQVQKNLVPPDIYQFNVPSTLTSTTAINEYAGISFNTYYKDSAEYISLGRRYLNFKTVILKTNFIPAEGSINPDDITTVNGYDESASAIKNITGIFGNDQVAKYNSYLQYIDDYMSIKTNGAVDNFEEFYKNNTSFTSNTIDYVDSIHIFTLSTKLFKYSSFVDLTNTDFILLKLDDVYVRVGNILKYNMINDMKYRDLICYDDSKIDILCGVVYEDGTIIICTPFVLNSSTMTATSIKATCLGSLSGPNKLSYTFDYNGSGSITGVLDTHQIVYKTVNGGSSFSALTSGSAFPYFTVKDFSDALTSISAALSAEATTNASSSTAQINWSITGSSIAGYMVLRSLSAITFAPTDGITAYTQGTTAADGSDIILYTTATSTSAASTGLTQGYLYNYSIIPFFGSPRAYYSPTLTNTYTLLAVEPASQLTSIQNVGVSSTFANITITPSGTGADKYLIRFAGGAVTITGNPVDAVGYAIMDILGNTRVGYTGSSTAYTQTGLTPQSLYSWQVLPYNGAIPTAYNYKINGTPATASFYTLCLPPAATPSNFTIGSRSATTATITYTIAPSVTGYLVMLKAGSSAPAPTISNAATYADGSAMSDGSIAVSSVLSSVSSIVLGSATALIPDSQYTIRIASFNRLTGQTSTTNFLQTNSLTGTVWTLAALPTLQPINAVITNRTVSQGTVSWTSTGSPERFLVLYRTDGLAPGDSPTAGDSYVIGTTIGSSKVGATGNGTSVNLVATPGALVSAKIYSYNGQPKDGSTGTQNYLTTSPLSTSFWTLTSEPTAITQSSLVSHTSTSASISFILAKGSPNYSGHIVLRKSNTLSPDETLLVDGTKYSIGDLGSGTYQSSTSVADPATILETGLATKTRYNYKIISYNEGSDPSTINYRISSYVSGTIWTLDTRPANNPSSITVSNRTLSTANITLTIGASTTGAIVITKTGSDPIIVPVDGVGYALSNPNPDLDANVSYTGATPTFDLTGLSPGAQHFVRAYSYNYDSTTAGDISTITYKTNSYASTIFWTLTSEPNFRATNLTFAIPTTASQTITFTAPVSNSTHVMVLYELGNSVVNIPTDGTAYSDDTTLAGSTKIKKAALSVTGSEIVNVTFSSPALLPGTLYTYRVIPLNRNAGSDTTSNYYTTSDLYPLTGSTYTQQVAPADSSIASINLVSVTSRSTSSMTASWTKASASGTLVSARALPNPGMPTNGVYYSQGASLPDSSFVSFVGTGVTSQTLSGFTADTLYYFRFIPYNEPWINYNLTSYGTFLCRTLATIPNAPPVISNVTSITTTGATINFSAYAGDANRFFTLYRQSTDLTSVNPVDGQWYIPNDTVAGGSFIGWGTSGVSVSYSNSAILNSQVFIRVYAAKGVNTTGSTAETSNRFLTTTYSVTSFWLLATVPEATTFATAQCTAQNQCTVSWSSPTAVPTNYMVFRIKGSGASSSITALPASSQPLNSFSIGTSYSGATLVAIKNNSDSPMNEFVDNDVHSRNWDDFLLTWKNEPGDHLRYKIISVQTSGPVNNQYAAGDQIEVSNLSWGL